MPSCAVLGRKHNPLDRPPRGKKKAAIAPHDDRDSSVVVNGSSAKDGLVEQPLPPASPLGRGMAAGLLEELFELALGLVGELVDAVVEEVQAGP